MGKREEKIVSFFSNLLTNSETINYDEAVKESLGLFDEITHVMTNGAKEEQEEIIKALETVNKKVTEQFDALCEEFGVSKEDVKKLIADPNNFSPEFWEVMQKLQTQMEPVKVKEDKPNKVKRKPKQWVSA